MRMSGLRFAKLDTTFKVDPHVFNQISWKPDISFLTQDQLSYLETDDSVNKVDLVIDLIGHKKPALRVVEVNLGLTDSSSLWFETGDPACRASYAKFDFASPDARSLISTQTTYEAKRDSSFTIIKIDEEGLGMEESGYDLAIIRTTAETESEISQLSNNIKPLLAPGCHVLFVKRGDFPMVSGSSSEDGSLEIIASPGTPNTLDSSPSTPRTSPRESDFGSEKDLSSEITPITRNLGTSLEDTFPLKNQLLAAAQGLGTTLEITDGFGPTAFLSRVEIRETQASTRRKLVLARFLENTPGLTPGLRSYIEGAGWNVSEQTYPFSSVTADTTVLVLDELSSPVMIKADVKQWDGLKSLVSTGAVILWVTQGAQYQVSNPNTALAHGLFRVIRMEDTNAKLVCLDVQSSTSPAIHRAITEVLDSLRGKWPKRNIETEFSERGGVIHVHRVVPDSEINEFKRQVAEGAEPVLQSLQENPRPVSLRVERLGTFQSLTWCETAVAEVPIEAGKVEVEIMAVGVNFKVHFQNDLLREQ